MARFTCGGCGLVLEGRLPLLQFSVRRSLVTGMAIVVVTWCPNGCDLATRAQA